MKTFYAVYVNASQSANIAQFSRGFTAAAWGVYTYAEVT